jgi:hypothetical protein
VLGVVFLVGHVSRAMVWARLKISVVESPSVFTRCWSCSVGAHLGEVRFCWPVSIAAQYGLTWVSMIR